MKEISSFYRLTFLVTSYVVLWNIHPSPADGLSLLLRCGADDCCKVWLNDKVVSEHEQWLNGTRFDRFIEEITLQEGRNSILVKVCQGPQHRNPEVFNNWSMQLRLCDKEGRGIAFESALAAEDTE